MVISMDRWKGKVAIVTGASAGIGVAIVEQLVEAGVHVVGLARRKELVEKLAKKLEGKPGKAYAFKADVSKEEDVVAAFKWTKENVGSVHILVNNAGFSRNTSLIDGETQSWKEILDTNVLGLCIATREAVKEMRANNIDGHIVHISSIAGHRVSSLPGLNVYPASKYAVRALTETLRQELNSIGSKIRISCISPGAVATEFADASGYSKNENFVNMLKNFTFLQAEDIADSVIYVLATPPHVQIHDIIVRPVGQTF